MKQSFGRPGAVGAGAAVATVGVDVGGTKIASALVLPDGRVPLTLRHPTPETFDGVVAAILGHVGELRAAHPGVGAVGVGAAGLVDAEGAVRYAPNVPALLEAPLGARLAEGCGLPVVVDNDANAAAWGEVVHGAAAGYRNVLVVTLGTGIGGGIVVDGALCRGAHGFAAEIGHFTVDLTGPVCACGEVGHWEALASGTALGAMARERAAAGGLSAVVSLAGDDPDAVEGEHLSAAAMAGDDEALAVLDEYAHLVAVGLAGLANVLDPELVVIGGGLVAMGETLLGRVRTSFSRRIEAPGHRPEIPVVAARLGEDAGAIGAAALARELAPGGTGAAAR